jgi:hypothetical protein
MPHDYITLRALVPAPQNQRPISIGSLQPESARTGLLRHGFDDPDPSEVIDRLLLQACHQQADADAFLCLRCRVSHCIEQKLLALVHQFGRYHGLDLIELATAVLDDQGGPIPWAPDPHAPISGQPARHQPFGAEVVRSYLPGASGLGHWARVRVQSHPELRRILREHGLLLISDWALLADSSPTRVRRAWASHGAGALTVDAAAALHAAYLPRYREAKERHRLLHGRGHGWSPDSAFLTRLEADQPARVTCERLQAMAAAIRREILGAMRDPQDVDELQLIDDRSVEPDTSSCLDSGELLPLLRATLLKAMERHMPPLLSGEGPEADLLRCLWRCYAEGLPQRAIAERCGTSQAMVTRRLQLQRLATTIATTSAMELKAHAAFAPIGRSVADAERIVILLRNHLISQEPGGVQSPLRCWLLEHLAACCPP